MENFSEADSLIGIYGRFRKLKHLLPCPEGLSRGEAILLHQIACGTKEYDDGAGIKISELSKRTQMSMPAVSQMLNTLEEKGLTERRMTKNDRRVVRVGMTKKGETMYKETKQNLGRFFQEVMQEFGKERTEQMISLLDGLCESMEKVNTRK